MNEHRVLLVQGAGDMWVPEGSGHLANYLHVELGARFDVRAPEMPDAAIGPTYAPWRNQIDAELRAVGGPVLLVGHSVGGSVVVKYLAEQEPAAPIRGLFLVSVPWWGNEGWGYDEFGLPADFASRLPTVRSCLTPRSAFRRGRNTRSSTACRNWSRTSGP